MATDVFCKCCGGVCGSYEPSRISGPVEDCHEAEWIEEPEIVIDGNNEEIYFCSLDCCDEYFYDIEEDNEEGEK